MKDSCNMPVYSEGCFEFLCDTVTEANSANGTKYPKT